MTDNDTPPCPFCGLKEDIYSIIDGDLHRRGGRRVSPIAK
jgi:hypothetical protein